MNRLETAAKLARQLSNAKNGGSVSFSDTFSILQSLRASRRPRRSVLISERSLGRSELLCGPGKAFLLGEDEFGTIGAVEVLETDLVRVRVLREEQARSVAMEPRSIRSLAMHHEDSPETLAYLAHVSVLLDDRLHCRFCSRCGAPREGKTCVRCGLEKYPRISPCAIVFVHDPWSDSVLLGRRPGSNYWSLLAGYCENLESIERCAVREVKEESGIDIDVASLMICSSQPWPFFSDKFEGTSLMFGCYAQAERPNQVPVTGVEELAEVQWLPIRELEARCKASKDSKEGSSLPARASMARFLMQMFVDAKHSIL